MSQKNKPVMRKPITQPLPSKSDSLPKAIIPLLQRSQDQEAMESALGKTTPSKPSGFQAAEIARAPGTYIVGQTYKLPLHMFQKSENNARVFYLPNEIDDMSKSLQVAGQDYPVLGYFKDGKIVLTDGQKRFQGAANGGLFELEVKIIAEPESESVEYEASRRVNIERSTQSGIDDAYKWQSLLQRGVYKSQDELADRLNLKKEKVSKILGITRIPERLIRQMLDNEQASNWSVAYLVSTIFDAKRIAEKGEDKIETLAQEVVDEIVKDGLSKRQIEALIAKKIQGPNKRTQPETSPIKLGEWKGEIKSFPSRGQLDLSFKGLTEEKVVLLRERLEEVLSKA